MSPLKSVEWLAERVNDLDVRVVDAAWYLPDDPRTGAAEYAREHIPCAVFFDIDEICDKSSNLPHMLAAPEDFAEKVGKLGIGSDHTVIVYDHLGLMSAARVWWNFKAMGHDEVFVLDGGLPRWRAQGLPVTNAVDKPVARKFVARPQPNLVRDWEQVRRALTSGVQVLDARGAGRFSGSEPGAHGQPSGHMPAALNLPWTSIVPDGSLLRDSELESAFLAAGVNGARPAITTCGSGVTGAILCLGLAELGWPDATLFDGSWTEWVSHPESEIVTDV